MTYAETDVTEKTILRVGESNWTLEKGIWFGNEEKEETKQRILNIYSTYQPTIDSLQTGILRRMVLIFTQEKEATFKDGCLSLRKSVLDKMRAKNAPGPIYNPKARVSSTEKTTFRDITFGTGPAR